MNRRDLIKAAAGITIVDRVQAYEGMLETTPKAKEHVATLCLYLADGTQVLKDFKITSVRDGEIKAVAKKVVFKITKSMAGKDCIRVTVTAKFGILGAKTVDLPVGLFTMPPNEGDTLSVHMKDPLIILS